MPIYQMKSKILPLTTTIKKEVFLLYLLFCFTSLGFILIYDKQNFHLLLNQFHTPFWDTFFKYATFLGDGLMFGILFLLLFLIQRKWPWILVISGILTLIITHFLKKIIFKGVPRPVGDLGTENLHLVEGVQMALWNSFPSGHTITAFCIGTILCLHFKKCTSQYLWFSLALIAALSRVYLSQHYWIDIFVGSFIGIAIGFLSTGLFSNLKRSALI